MDFLGPVLAYLGTIPAIGAWLQAAASLCAALVVAVTALVSAWHGIVMVFEILSSLPGLTTLKAFADSLKADEAKVDSDETIILGFLNRVSILPLPTAKKS